MSEPVIPLNARAVGERLGIKPATWRAYVSRGQAPAPDLEIGGSPMWWPTTVDAWRGRNIQSKPSTTTEGES